MRMAKGVFSYLAMFVVCFAGVFSALVLNERLNQSAEPGMSNPVTVRPIRYGRVPSEVAFADAARRLMPSVVSVDRIEASLFGPDYGTLPSGQASGVIVTPNGYIVTNYHVIEGADRLVVRTVKGERYPARIAGADPISDLALLKVDAKTLPAAELGDSGQMKVGEWVLAVGNPLGYEGTLSVGIVSALNRDLPVGPSAAPLVGAIQTDAAINQGNSGGALANVQGQVIGINTVIASTDRGNIGIGFAIPSNRVERVVNEIIKHGRIRHPDLGVLRFAPSQLLQHPAFESEIGPDPPGEGLVVRDVAPDSPIARAGVERWDVIVEIGGKPMRGLNEYMTYLLKAEIGDKATIKFWKRGQYKTVTVQLAEVSYP